MAFPKEKELKKIREKLAKTEHAKNLTRSIVLLLISLSNLANDLIRI